MIEQGNGVDKSDKALDLGELCRQGDVTVRTVRYYVQQGLLPSPGLGAGARYGTGHLARLRLIRRMQREHLPLAEIRRRLEGLDDEAIRQLLETPPSTAVDSPTSAVDYARAALGMPDQGRPPIPPRRPSPLSSGALSAVPGSVALPVSSAIPKPRPTIDRAQWDRIALTPDVELHVRRPLSREDNRRVEKLLEQARELFSE